MINFSEYVNKVYNEFMSYMKYETDKNKLDKWFYAEEQQSYLRKGYESDVKDYQKGIPNAFEDGAGYAMFMMYEI